MLAALRAAAVVEATSLLLLLANLATLHLPAVASLVGPVHGTAYLTVIATSLLAPAAGRARWRALVPGVGGLLALRAPERRGRSQPTDGADDQQPSAAFPRDQRPSHQKNGRTQ